jgi:hypothetical protein
MVDVFEVPRQSKIDIYISLIEEQLEMTRPTRDGAPQG